MAGMSFKGIDFVMAGITDNKGDNPMASYVEATGTSSFTKANQPDVKKPTV